MRKPHGFSLIEVVVVLSVLAILATLTINGLSGLRNRASVNSFLGELALDIRNASHQATQRSQPVVIVLNIDPAHPMTNGYFLFVETEGTVDLDNLTEVPPTDVPGLRQLGFTHMERPFLSAAKPSNAATYSTLFPYSNLFASLGTRPPCTFCKSYGAAWRGGMRLMPDSRVFMSSDGDTIGGGVIFADLTSEGGAVTSTRALAILAPSGMTRIF